MATIINVNFLQHSINNSELINYIAPAVEDVAPNTVVEHASHPIKSLDDIHRISEYFIAQKKYRNNMLWIIGINFGLRVSDLVRLRFTDIIDDNFNFKSSFAILEKKTSKTRKVPKNRHITINDAVKEAVLLYLQNTPGVTLSDYMFRSESNNGKNKNKPLDTFSVETMLKTAAKDLGLTEHVATHTLRKTFGYHQMMMSNNDPRKLLILQKMFGHSTSAQTLEYIGITSEEIEDAYLNLNLGSKYNYLVNSRIQEVPASSVS